MYSPRGKGSGRLCCFCQPEYLPLPKQQRQIQRLVMAVEVQDERLSKGDPHYVQGDNGKVKEFIEILQRQFTREKEANNLDFIREYRENRFRNDKNRRNSVQIQRWAEIKFVCQNQKCPRFEESWVSVYGLIAFRFYFDHCAGQVSVRISRRMKYPYLLRYQVHIYEQQCMKCYKTGASFIFGDNVHILVTIFILIIQLALIIHPNPLLKISFGRDSPQILRGQQYRLPAGYSRRHLRKLCEACRVGKCRYLTKNQQEHEL